MEGTDEQRGDELIRARREKLEYLRREGVDPYTSRFPRTDFAGDLQGGFKELDAGETSDQRVSLAGRIMARRAHGKACFVDLKDSSGTIQLYFKEDVLGVEEYGRFLHLDVGDWIGVEGTVFRSRRGELSILVETYRLLSKSLRPLPEKWHGLKDQETRYRQRYLDLITNPQAEEALRVRTLVTKRIRAFLDERGFVEVETPVLQSLPGGANARPFVTHHEALGMDLYLRIAPELYLKRLLIGGLEKVYELGRNFRNEGISSRHNPEFSMLEVYQAFADYRDLQELTQELICDVVKTVKGGLVFEYQGEELDFTPPWLRMTMLEALHEYAGLEIDFDTDIEVIRKIATENEVKLEPHYGIGWAIGELFEKIVEGGIRQPTFIMDYPKEISPLARTCPRDQNLTERFEVIVAGREIANAFSELTDPQEQRQRFEEQARRRSEGDEEAHPVDEDFLTALEYGMPPAGGLGVGVDRLVMLVADYHNIRDVITFPHLRPKEGRTQ